jgi:hypothetical protein
MYHQFATCCSGSRITAASAAHVLAWTALVAVTLVLAFVLQTLVAGSRGAAVPAESTIVCTTTGSSTAALADGDDIRARFLARSAVQHETQQPESVCMSRISGQ